MKNLFLSLFKKLNQSLIKTLGTTLTISTIIGSNVAPVGAETLDWQSFWDCDSTDKVRTITNYNDSGVDITIEYSDNLGGALKLYQKEGQPLKCLDNHQHELWAYDGVLRTTAAWDAKPTYVKVTFSEPVYIDDLWLGNLSVRTREDGDQYEWMELSGYSTDDVDLNNVAASESYLVSASKLDHYEGFFGVTCPYLTVAEDEPGSECNMEITDNPDYVEIIDDGSKVYKFKGIGRDTLNQKGRAFGAYQDTPVQTLLIGMYLTDAGTNEVVGSSSSAAISPTIGFTRSDITTEPPTIDPPAAIIYAD